MKCTRTYAINTLSVLFDDKILAVDDADIFPISFSAEINLNLSP